MKENRKKIGKKEPEAHPKKTRENKVRFGDVDSKPLDIVEKNKEIDNLVTNIISQDVKKRLLQHLEEEDEEEEYESTLYSEVYDHPWIDYN